jgi:hypothetical protein
MFSLLMTTGWGRGGGRPQTIHREQSRHTVHTVLHLGIKEVSRDTMLADMGYSQN